MSYQFFYYPFWMIICIFKLSYISEDIILSNKNSLLMADRLESLKNKFVSEPVDYMSFYSFVPKEEREKLKQIDNWAREHLTTHEITECVEEAKFPSFLIKPLQKLNIIQYFVGKPYGNPMSLLSQGLILAILSSYDTSISTFIMLQGPLCGKTLQKLATEEQKQQYLPDLVKLNKIWGWALTEEKIGSNATQLQTNTKQNNQGFLLNGNKKWIGNGNRDFLIVYAKNLGKNKIHGYIVDQQLSGIKVEKIEKKLALRMVENCKITFNNVQLDKEAWMPDAKSFKKGVESMLKLSRIQVLFIAAGACIGVYRHLIKYTQDRKQFGKNIAAFQMMQLKVYEVMANLQGILMMCWRATELASTGGLTLGHVGMFKAWITERSRHIAKIGREALGGNGITHDRYIMKALCDIEALYTYQGTYDVNALVAARQLTGISAFR